MINSSTLQERTPGKLAFSFDFPDVGEMDSLDVSILFFVCVLCLFLWVFVYLLVHLFAFRLVFSIFGTLSSAFFWNGLHSIVFFALTLVFSFLVAEHRLTFILSRSRRFRWSVSDSRLLRAHAYKYHSLCHFQMEQQEKLHGQVVIRCRKTLRKAKRREQCLPARYFKLLELLTRFQKFINWTHACLCADWARSIKYVHLNKTYTLTHNLTARWEKKFNIESTKPRSARRCRVWL